MHPVATLILYSLICVVASLGGGWVPLVVRLTHRRMQIAISFVSGIVLGIGLLHLVPHSFAELGSIDQTVLWVLAGFLFMFFLERFFHFHHHDAPGDVQSLDSTLPQADEHEHGAACAHGHTHHHHAPSAISGAFPWIGVAIGLTLHGLIDGLALAAAVKAEAGHGVALAGLGALLAVALHKPFDSLTIGTMMAASGESARSRHLFNAAYALVTPLGIALFYWLATLGGSQFGLGQTLGFAAGAFICIATGDLLPELQFHRHDRSALSMSLLAGIALAWGTVFLEESGHDHFHGRSHGTEHSHGAPAHADEHDHAHEPHEHDGHH
jgi:zinc and cadmium transporter